MMTEDIAVERAGSCRRGQGSEGSQLLLQFIGWFELLAFTTIAVGEMCMASLARGSGGMIPSMCSPCISTGSASSRL